MESSPSTANSGLVFVNFNQDFGCFVAVTSEGFRIFNADPLRQNKTDCKSFSALAKTVKEDGENSSVYLGPTITDVVNGKARVVKVTIFSYFLIKKNLPDGTLEQFKMYVMHEHISNSKLTTQWRK